MHFTFSDVTYESTAEQKGGKITAGGGGLLTSPMSVGEN